MSFCFERLITNKNELQLLAADAAAKTIISKEVKATILSDAFWDKVHDLLTLLRPSLEKITVTEADKPHLSLWSNYFQG